MGKDKKPEVVGQSMERVTTNAFDPKKPGKFKVGKLKGKQGLNVFDLFNPFGFGLFADEPIKKVHAVTFVLPVAHSKEISY